MVVSTHRCARRMLDYRRDEAPSGTKLDFLSLRRTLPAMAKAISGPGNRRAGRRGLTSVLACLAWLIAVVSCPGFGQALAQDEPVAAQEQTGADTTGHVDADLCCKALGDTSTVMRAAAVLLPLDFASTPAPLFVAPHSPVIGLFSAQPPTRPPPDDQERHRIILFLAFWSHAPPPSQV